MHNVAEYIVNEAIIISLPFLLLSLLSLPPLPPPSSPSLLPLSLLLPSPSHSLPPSSPSLLPPLHLSSPSPFLILPLSLLLSLPSPSMIQMPPDVMEKKMNWPVWLVDQLRNVVKLMNHLESQVVDVERLCADTMKVSLQLPGNRGWVHVHVHVHVHVDWVYII